MGDWAEAVIATCTVVSVVVTAATAYLRLYVGQRLAQLQESLPTQICRANFVGQEIFEARLKPIERRLEWLEKLEIEGEP